MRTAGTLLMAFVLGTSLSACATKEGARQGSAGPVAWEVTDISQTVPADRREIRWDYTILLKETAGKTILFDRLESWSEEFRVIGPPHVQTTAWRLGPRSEFRVTNSYVLTFFADGVPNFSDSVPGGQMGVLVGHRLHGKDETGGAVLVEVRLRLDPSVGKK